MALTISSVNVLFPLSKIISSKWRDNALRKSINPGLKYTYNYNND